MVQVAHIANFVDYFLDRQTIFLILTPKCKKTVSIINSELYKIRFQVLSCSRWWLRSRKLRAVEINGCFLPKNIFSTFLPLIQISFRFYKTILFTYNYFIYFIFGNSALKRWTQLGICPIVEYYELFQIIKNCFDIFNAINDRTCRLLTTFFINAPDAMRFL